MSKEVHLLKVLVASPSDVQKERDLVKDAIEKELARNGRDYSKPTLESQLSKSRISEGKDRQKPWLKIVSVPMGGQNKKY